MREKPAGTNLAIFLLQGLHPLLLWAMVVLAFSGDKLRVTGGGPSRSPRCLAPYTAFSVRDYFRKAGDVGVIRAVAACAFNSCLVQPEYSLAFASLSRFQ